ncbi:MAG: hypothetical protein LBP79_04720 [Clostridiales bacterium]|jgi:hypothetical protein|nr:hypothetical protein [Clostridiales bacterium]
MKSKTFDAKQDTALPLTSLKGTLLTLLDVIVLGFPIPVIATIAAVKNWSGLGIANLWFEFLAVIPFFMGIKGYSLSGLVERRLRKKRALENPEQFERKQGE